MRLLLIIMLLPIFSIGQFDTTKFYRSPNVGEIFRRAKINALMLPSDTTTNKVGIAQIGGSLYTYGSGKWNAIGQFDTTTLSNRINTKLNISDTSSMLLSYKHWLVNYLRTSDTTILLASKAFTNATYALRNRAIVAGYGLSGGGDLSADRSFIVDTTVIASKPFVNARFNDTANQTRTGTLSRFDFARFNSKTDKHIFTEKLNSVRVGKDSLSIVFLGNSNTSMDALDDINGKSFVAYFKQKVISNNYFLKGYGFSELTPSPNTYDAAAFPLINFTYSGVKTYSTVQGFRNITTFTKSFVRVAPNGTLDIRKPTPVESPIVNRITLYYNGTGVSNTLSVTLNGTSIGTLNTNTGTGTQSVTYTVADSRLSTLVLTANAGNTDSIQLFGVHLEHRGSNGVSVHKIAEFDSNIKQWDSIPQAEFNFYLQNLNTDLVVLHFGTNEKFIKMPLDTFYNCYTTIVNKIKVSRPNAHIVLVGFPYDIRTGTTDNDTRLFDSVTNRVAYDNGVEYLSLAEVFGRTAIAQGLFQNDNIHYSVKGSQAIAESVYEFINLKERCYYSNPFVVATGGTIPNDYTYIVLRQIGSSQFLDLPTPAIWGNKRVRIFNSNDLSANTWTIRNTATGLSYVIPLSKAVTVYNYNNTYVIED